METVTTFKWGIDLPIFIVVYLLVLIFIGYFSYRRRVGVTVKDFFTANRSLGYIVLGIALFATIASGNTFLGYSGNAYRTGLSFLVAPAFYLSILVGLFIMAAKIIPIASKRNYITPGDYFIDRYGSKALSIILILLMFWATFVQFFEQDIAIGYIGEVTSGGYIPYYIAAAIFLAVSLIIILTGGFRGSALTNFIMGIVMIIGLLGVVFVVLPILGGTKELATLASDPKMTSYLAPKGVVFLNGWLSNLILIMFGVLSYYQIWTFVIANKDFQSFRKQYIFSPLVYVLVPTFFVIIGIFGKALIPNLSGTDADKIVPLILNNAAQKSLSGYIMGEFMYLAVISATLSTAAAVMFSIGSILSKDLFARLANRTMEDKEVINISKIIMVVIGILGYIIVMTPKFTLWRWVELKFEIGLQAVPALVLGIYFAWVNKKGIWTGIISGLIVTLLLTFTGHAKVLGFHAGVIGVVINFVLALIVSYLTKQPEEIEAASKIIS
jgi:sodium/pantothenate symporter